MDIRSRIFHETANGNVAFIPFTILGFPDLATSEKGLQILEDYGATIFETAIPVPRGFSSETNRAIKTANRRACDNGVTYGRVIDAYRIYRPNICIVYRSSFLPQLDVLLSDMSDSVDGILLERGIIGEKKALEYNRMYGLEVLQAVTPEMSDLEIEKLVRSTQGMIYLTLSFKTGGRIYPLELISRKISHIKSIRQDIPVCCGFGLRNAQDIDTIARIKGCDGIIVGTPLLQAIERGIKDFEDTIKSMILATRNVR